MPEEKSIQDVPEGVQDLPLHAREIYMKAHNNALKQYQDPSKRRGGSAESVEEVAHKVAWAAVKQEYEKNDKGEWVKKS